MLHQEFSWKVKFVLNCQTVNTGDDINILIKLHLCKDGPGIKDPCEKEAVDATSVLTSQQCEDITQSAQVRRVC